MMERVQVAQGYSRTALCIDEPSIMLLFEAVMSAAPSVSYSLFIAFIGVLFFAAISYG